MTEVQSYIYDFQRVPRFFDDMNVNGKFKLLDMDGASSNFQIVFCSYSPSNLDDCIGSDGKLTSDVTVQQAVDCKLKWENNAISVVGDTQWTIGDNVYPLKAVFIRDKVTQYVLGYCINIMSFEVTNKIIFDGGTILWSISDE